MIAEAFIVIEILALMFCLLVEVRRRRASKPASSQILEQITERIFSKEAPEGCYEDLGFKVMTEMLRIRKGPTSFVRKIEGRKIRH